MHRHNHVEPGFGPLLPVRGGVFYWGTTLLLLSFAACGCRCDRVTFAVGSGNSLPPGLEPPAYFSSTVDFNHLNADDYVVKGMLPGTGRRWTTDGTELQFLVTPKSDLRFFVDLTVHEDTFRTTGPVTITFRICSHVLGQASYDRAGDYRFEAAVPQELITAGVPVKVFADASPLWVSPTDGVRLGFLIERAGFK